jgi:hypothetical protein
VDKDDRDDRPGSTQNEENFRFPPGLDNMDDTMTSKFFVAFLAFAFLLIGQAYAQDAVCPETISQGGNTESSTNFTLSCSVGGIVGTTMSTNFTAADGYMAQTLAGCNCVPCADFIENVCTQLTANLPTTFVDLQAVTQQLLTAANLFSVSICADGSSGSTNSEDCAAYIQGLLAP